MAFEKTKSVKQLFLETILCTFMSLFKKGQVSMSMLKLVKSSNMIFEKILKESGRNCIVFMGYLNRLVDQDQMINYD